MSRRKIIHDSGDDEMLGEPSSSSVLPPAAPAVGTFPPANGAGNLSYYWWLNVAHEFVLLRVCVPLLLLPLYRWHSSSYH